MNILSFLAETWDWELHLADEFENTKFTFEGVEKSIKVHKDSYSYCNSINRQNMNCSIAKTPITLTNHILECNKTYDLVYLDWMGTWSEKKRRQTDILFRNKIVDGYLVIPIMLSRGKPENINRLANTELYAHIEIPIVQFYDGLQPEKYKPETLEAECEGVPTIISKIGEEYGYKCIPISISVYDGVGSDNRSIPEVSIIIKAEILK